jgi:hypothetical protein
MANDRDSKFVQRFAKAVADELLQANKNKFVVSLPPNVALFKTN